MKKNSGMTLIETMLATFVFTIAVSSLLQVFEMNTKGMVQAQNRISLKDDLSLLNSNIIKTLSGETRFYAFSGLPAPERSLFRFLLPLANMGRDLSLPNHMGDMGLLYIGYDRNVTPTVKIVCADQADYNRVLLDQGDDSFGAWEVHGNTIRVMAAGGYPGGDIEIRSGTQISALAPPHATVWMATGGIQKLPNSFYRQNSSGQFVGNIPNPECLKGGLRVIGGSPGKEIYDTSRLYSVPIQAFVPHKFTGGNVGNVTQQNRKDALANPPYRMFQVGIRALGALTSRSGPKKFGISKCLIQPNKEMICPSTVFDAGPVESVKLELDYRVDLKMDFPCDAPSRVGGPVTRYEITPMGNATSNWCSEDIEGHGPCVRLPIPFLGAGEGFYRVTSSGGGCDAHQRESIQNLNRNEFSLVKQDLLSGMKFWIKSKEGQENVQILFP